MSKTHLAALKPGQAAVIASLQTPSGLYQRLNALGFRTGRQIVMVRAAWLSGPMHVRIGTTEVMLRRRDAQFVQVTNIVSAS